jgi:small ligand-binding sensory domain FIST
VKITAKSVLSRQRNSIEAGRSAGAEIVAGMPALPKVVLCYLTVNHDQAQFIAGLVEKIGPSVPIVGCSGQGVMGRGVVHEDGYAASLMALGGEGLEVGIARVDDVQSDTRAKGAALGQKLRDAHARPPKVCIVHYAPTSILARTCSAEVRSRSRSAGMSAPRWSSRRAARRWATSCA